MLYAELIAKVAEDCGLSRYKVGQVLGSFIKVSTEALLSGSRVRLREFGTFYTLVSKRKTVFGKQVIARPVVRFKESRHGQVRRRARR
jgi:nucleoid DNA-binding protein